MKFKFLFLGLILAISNMTFAATSPELVSYIENEIATFDNAMASSETNTPSVESLPKNDDRFYLTNFWLRVRPRVAFLIPGILRIEVAPEIELSWQRDLPEGYVIYKP